MHAKRTGGFAAFARTGPVSAARIGSDSSHGRVRVIPAAPRRNARRERDSFQEKAWPAFMVTCLPRIHLVCTNEITLCRERVEASPSPLNGERAGVRSGDVRRHSLS